MEIEVAAFVVNVCDAAGHARAEVDACRAEDKHLAARHVLAAVVSDSLGDERRAGIAYAEALARLSAYVYLARSRAVCDDVSCDDVSFWDDVGLGRSDRDDAAGEGLADIVVSLADEVEGDALREERAERLARDTGEVDG